MRAPPASVPSFIRQRRSRTGRYEDDTTANSTLPRPQSNEVHTANGPRVFLWPTVPELISGLHGDQILPRPTSGDGVSFAGTIGG